MRKIFFTAIMAFATLTANAQLMRTEELETYSTTHGYQFNPNVFLGGGMKFQYHSFDNFDNTYSMPFYADFMVNMTDSKISPFLISN